LAAAVKPRPEFRQRAGNEFQKAITEMPSKKVGSVFKWQARWIAPVAVILVLLSGGAGTVVAATNALPDSPLYGVKMAVESVQMAFTFSGTGKAELYARFVDYRVEEIVKMAENGRFDQVEQATERMNSQLLAMADLDFNGGAFAEDKGMAALQASAPDEEAAASTTAPAATQVPAPPLRNTDTSLESSSAPADDAKIDESQLTEQEKLKLLLLEKAAYNLQLLRDQLEKAPEYLKPALQKAIEVAEQGYAQAIANLE
ncbi:MAG: hypothetical protein A2Z15_03775, partial [Chloroflexi bacterium RBG_16_50_11]